MVRHGAVSLDLGTLEIVAAAVQLTIWMALLRFQDAQRLPGGTNVVTPQRRLSFASSGAGIGIFAPLEGIPVGFPQFEEAGDAQVLTIAASEGKALGAKK